MIVSRSAVPRKALVYALILSGAVVSVFPFWYMLVTSLKPQSYIFEIPPRLWPAEVTFANYAKALARDSFARYFLNSVVVAAFTTVLTVTVSSLLAYAFGRMDFPFRKAAFFIVIIGLMIPPVMLIIPQFLVARSLRLLNSLVGLVVVYVAMNLPMQTFLLKGFFEGIPKDLEESAFMDGAGRWRVWAHLLLPLSRPALAVVTIFSFIFAWDEFAWAHVAIRTAAKRTLPIAIAFFQTQHKTEWGIVFAASIISLVPIVVVFIVFQRYFIEGITTTGLKG
jgi:multiple sugar transport system permease protein